jgi:hypothetical protein
MSARPRKHASDSSEVSEDESVDSSKEGKRQKEHGSEVEYFTDAESERSEKGAKPKVLPKVVGKCKPNPSSSSSSDEQQTRHGRKYDASSSEEDEPNASSSRSSDSEDETPKKPAVTSTKKIPKVTEARKKPVSDKKSRSASSSTSVTKTETERSSQRTGSRRHVSDRSRSGTSSRGQAQIRVAVVGKEKNKQDMTNSIKKNFNSPFFAVEKGTYSKFFDPVEEFKNSNLPLLVIKNTSILVLSKIDLEELLLSVLDSNYDFDTLFLCCMSDEINKRTDTDNKMIKWTQSAKGTQAILFSVEGLKRVTGKTLNRSGKTFPQNEKFGRTLAEEIRKGNIKSLVTKTNVVNFDSDFATKLQHLEMSGVKDVGALTKKCNEGGNGEDSTSKIWIFAILIFIILVVACGMYGRRRYCR